jgi:hypothetical protein
MIIIGLVRVRAQGVSVAMMLPRLAYLYQPEIGKRSDDGYAPEISPRRRSLLQSKPGLRRAIARRRAFPDPSGDASKLGGDEAIADPPPNILRRLLAKVAIERIDPTPKKCACEFERGSSRNEAVTLRRRARDGAALRGEGVADPSGIAITFADTGLRDRFRLDSVICVIGADRVFAHPNYPAIEQL